MALLDNTPKIVLINGTLVAVGVDKAGNIFGAEFDEKGRKVNLAPGQGASAEADAFLDKYEDIIRELHDSGEYVAFDAAKLSTEKNRADLLRAVNFLDGNVTDWAQDVIDGKLSKVDVSYTEGGSKNNKDASFNLTSSGGIISISGHDDPNLIFALNHNNVGIKEVESPDQAVQPSGKDSVTINKRLTVNGLNEIPVYIEIEPELEKGPDSGKRQFTIQVNGGKQVKGKLRFDAAASGGVVFDHIANQNDPSLGGTIKFADVLSGLSAEFTEAAEQLDAKSGKYNEVKTAVNARSGGLAAVPVFSEDEIKNAAGKPVEDTRRAFVVVKGKLYVGEATVEDGKFNGMSMDFIPAGQYVDHLMEQRKGSAVKPTKDGIIDELKAEAEKALVVDKILLPEENKLSELSAIQSQAKTENIPGSGIIERAVKRLGDLDLSVDGYDAPNTSRGNRKDEMPVPGYVTEAQARLIAAAEARKAAAAVTPQKPGVVDKVSEEPKTPPASQPTQQHGRKGLPPALVTTGFGAAVGAIFSAFNKEINPLLATGIGAVCGYFASRFPAVDKLVGDLVNGAQQAPAMSVQLAR